jgi:type IX secretion system PorP/SprF family membrane protein
MKKLLLVLSIFAGALTLRAQQDAQYSQFFLNKLTYNPAYAGTEGNKICATGLYRSQWLGFGKSSIGLSPTTYLLNIHAPLGNFGVGLNVNSDQLGFEQSINPMLSVSYKLAFQDQSVLSFGLGGGIMQKSLAGDKLRPLDQGDQSIPNASVSGISPDINLGLYYMTPNLWRFTDAYAGLSATHLTQGNVRYEWPGGSVDNPMKMHYYFMTGATYNLGAFDLEPNILVKSDIAKTSADINAMLMYNNRIRGGLTYRTADAVVVLVGYKFTDNIQVGYSYDLTTSKIINYSSGSHELVLKYCFTPKLKEKEPKQPIPRLTPRFL